MLKKLSFACFLTFILTACSTTTSIKTAKDNIFTLQVLGINDFHGQVLPKQERGGMRNLAAHLLAATESTSDHTFILHAGDHVGASPAESALLQDEPSITFLNYMADFCQNHQQETCYVIGTAGNHEFDEGTPEMLRLLHGGVHAKGPFLEPSWAGAKYTNLSANVFARDSGQLILPPYVIQQVNGVEIGIIGLTLDYTPDLVVPGAVDDLYFADQAEVAQRYVTLLEEQGINAIIIVVHDGTRDKYYSGATQTNSRIDKNSKFGQFLGQLPTAVDLVVTGHSHRFTNAYFSRKNAPSLLVTQAFSSGRAYADITLTIDPAVQDITKASAEVIFANADPDLVLSSAAQTTLQKVDNLISSAVSFAQAYTEQVIGTYAPKANEADLGVFIANSHQYMLNTDMGIMNKGGVRSNIKPGPVKWGDLFAVQPFNNPLIVREYTGVQLLALIDDSQHWTSNITRRFNGSILWQGQALDPLSKYTVGGNAYIMNSERFAVGKLLRVDILDIDATSAYIKLVGPVFDYSSLPKSR